MIWIQAEDKTIAEVADVTGYRTVITPGDRDLAHPTHPDCGDLARTIRQPVFSRSDRRPQPVPERHLESAGLRLSGRAAARSWRCSGHPGLRRRGRPGRCLRTG